MMFEQKTFRKLYKKFLALYPRAFRAQFGESMEQTFDDLCRERQQRAEHGLFGFVLWMFIETAIGIVKERLIQIKEEKTMENIFSNHKSAAITGFILALPFAILLTIAKFDIEPFNGQIKTLFSAADGIGLNALGMIVIIGTALLLPVALTISLVPLVRIVRAGNSITAYPVNLLISVALLGFLTIVVGGIIIDQYPCWMGVPNCD